MTKAAINKGFLRLFILCGLVIAITVSIMSQEISLKSTPSSLKILPGEPATFQLTVRNTSGKNLKIIGTNLEHALTPTESILISPDGKAFKCSHMAIEVAPGIQPPCQRPTVLFPKDGTVTMVYGIHSHKSCPLSSIPPGTYTGRITVEIRVCFNGNAKEIKQTLDIPVIVVTPQGQDAAYLKAIEEIVKKQPPKYTGIYGGELKWMEVLHSPRIHSEQLLLSDFPTSTYAGYALERKVPDYSNPLFKPVPPQQQVRMSRDEGKTVVTFSNKAFEKFFKQLDAFMQGGRVPESLRTRLYGFYGDLLVQRGRLQEAEEAFKKAVLSKPQNEEDKAYFKRAQAFLTALKAKSPCRKIEKGKD